MRGPTAADLFGLDQGFYIDFPGSALSPGCIYESDFWKYTGDRPAAVYAHIVQDQSEGGRLYLQYWFYWYFNDWNNKHESDWEGITLQFEAGSIEEALAGEPIAVGVLAARGRRACRVGRHQADARGRPPDRVLVGRLARQLLRVGRVPRAGRQRGIRMRHDDRPVRSRRARGRGAARQRRRSERPAGVAGLQRSLGRASGRAVQRPDGAGPESPLARSGAVVRGSPRRQRRDPGRESAGQVGRQRLLRRRGARLAGADQLQDVARPGRARRSSWPCCW